MRAKYIILMDSHGIEHAIVFSPIKNHGDFLYLEDGIHTKIVSAGLVTISNNFNNNSDEPLIQCYGMSVTLGINSRGKTDDEIIKRNFVE